MHQSLTDPPSTIHKSKSFFEPIGIMRSPDKNRRDTNFHLMQKGTDMKITSAVTQSTSMRLRHGGQDYPADTVALHLYLSSLQRSQHSKHLKMREGSQKSFQTTQREAKPSVFIKHDALWIKNGVIKHDVLYMLWSFYIGCFPLVKRLEGVVTSVEVRWRFALKFTHKQPIENARGSLYHTNTHNAQKGRSFNLTIDLHQVTLQ